MSTIIAYQPGGKGPGSIARIAWQASQGLLAATRAGRRDLAEKISVWMINTREDPRCTPALGRILDSALAIAFARFGGAGPGFVPIQSDDGEAA